MADVEKQRLLGVGFGLAIGSVMAAVAYTLGRRVSATPLTQPQRQRYQITNSVMMIRPAAFGVNPETAASNSFQKAADMSDQLMAQRAKDEVDTAAATLRRHGVDVTVLDDTLEPAKPDAVFPNNWVSFHPNGRVVLYPIHAPNRRLERRIDLIESLKRRFFVSEVIDLGPANEEKKIFLEGTGSMVMDHRSRVIYACLSPRTHQSLLDEVGQLLGYEVISFDAVDEKGKSVYHTNVLMAIGDRFAVLCSESIRDQKERQRVQNSLRDSGHEIIDISFAQMGRFAGNVLQLLGKVTRTGHYHPIVVMSETAYRAFTPSQRERLDTFGGTIVPLSIPTIEYGGGSARCTIAEIFNPIIHS